MLRLQNLWHISSPITLLTSTIFLPLLLYSVRTICAWEEEKHEERGGLQVRELFIMDKRCFFIEHYCHAFHCTLITVLFSVTCWIFSSPSINPEKSSGKHYVYVYSNTCTLRCQQLLWVYAEHPLNNVWPEINYLHKQHWLHSCEEGNATLKAPVIIVYTGW